MLQTRKHTMLEQTGVWGKKDTKYNKIITIQKTSGEWGVRLLPGEGRRLHSLGPPLVAGLAGWTKAL